MMAEDRDKSSGFTLIEIIVVMTLLAIFSVTVIAHFVSNDVELVAGIDSLKSHLRFAQSRAMSTTDKWYVKFYTDTEPYRYALYRYVDGGGADTPMAFPGESDQQVELAEGITVNSGWAAICFDYLGRPYKDEAGTEALLAKENLVTSTAGNVEIRPETGYIP